MPYGALASPRVMDLLAQHDLEVLVAVTPARVDEIGALSRTYGDAGLSLGLWPMLADADGRWGSTYNAQSYADLVLRVVASARPGTTVAIDLEPPIAMVRGLLRGHPKAYRRLLRSDSWAPGQQILATLMHTLNDRGTPCLAAANPMLLADGRGHSAWQWLFGTPIMGLPFDAVSFMAYTSLLEGYSRGLIDRQVARSLLKQTADAALAQWGPRASLSIGTVGGGALGDERPYGSVAELADDVAVARACGVEDLALFDLSGVLQRSDPGAWLRAFTATAPATELPHQPKRARLLKAAVRRGGSAVGWYRRLRHLDR